MNDPCAQYVKEFKEFEKDNTVLLCEESDDFLYHLMDCKKCRDVYISIQAPIDEKLREFYTNYESRKILKPIGFWKENSLDEVHADPRNLPTDQNIDSRIITYLKNGSEYSISPGYSFCRFECGISDYKMGCREFHDGIYMWPEGLTHYLEVHKISLPKFFLDHIASNNYEVPVNNYSGEYRMCSKEWGVWCSQYIIKEKKTIT